MAMGRVIMRAVVAVGSCAPCGGPVATHDQFDLTACAVTSVGLDQVYAESCAVPVPGVPVNTMTSWLLRQATSTTLPASAPASTTGDGLLPPTPTSQAAEERSGWEYCGRERVPAL